MSADSTTETGLGIILRPSVPIRLSRDQGVAPVGRSGLGRSGARIAVLLESAILIMAGVVVAFGLGLIAYGITTAIVEGPGHPLPTVQLPTTQPMPRK